MIKHIKPDEVLSYDQIEVCGESNLMDEVE